MSDGEYGQARRHILKLRRAARMVGPFTFSYSCGATRLDIRPSTSWPPPPARAPRESEFHYAPESWVDVNNRTRFVGTADQLIADFRLLEAAGVDHVTLRFGSTDVGDLERFATEVQPAFLP